VIHAAALRRLELEVPRRHGQASLGPRPHQPGGVTLAGPVGQLVLGVAAGQFREQVLDRLRRGRGWVKVDAPAAQLGMLASDDPAQPPQR